jgi:hypothetical protein
LALGKQSNAKRSAVKHPIPLAARAVLFSVLSMGFRPDRMTTFRPNQAALAMFKCEEERGTIGRCGRIRSRPELARAPSGSGAFKPLKASTFQKELTFGVRAMKPCCLHPLVPPATQSVRFPRWVTRQREGTTGARRACVFSSDARLKRARADHTPVFPDENTFCTSTPGGPWRSGIKHPDHCRRTAAPWTRLGPDLSTAHRS